MGAKGLILDVVWLLEIALQYYCVQFITPGHCYLAYEMDLLREDIVDI